MYLVMQRKNTPAIVILFFALVETSLKGFQMFGEFYKANLYALSFRLMKNVVL